MPVRQRRAGVWQIDIRLGGRRIRRDIRAETKREAVAAEAALRAEFDPRQVTETLAGACVRWHREGCPDSYRTFIRALGEELGNPDLADIPDLVPDYVAALRRRGLSPAAINRRLATLRRLLNLAFKRWGWLKFPIGQRIELVSERAQARHVYLSRDDVELLACACEDVGRFVLTLAYTGMRWRSEALSLTGDQVRDGVIYLGTETKTQRPRAIPLHPRVADLPAWLPWGFSEKTVQRRFDAARYWIGRPDVRPHDLRHTFASWLAASDAPWFAIRDLLGHTDARTTSRYSHLRAQALRAAVIGL